MFCYNCGEENPEEAKFCRNCGTLLRKEETVKKVEVIEAPKTTQQNNSYHSHEKTTTSSSSNSSNWIGCCLCLIGIFIVFAVIGSF